MASIESLYLPLSSLHYSLIILCSITMFANIKGYEMIEDVMPDSHFV